MNKVHRTTIARTKAKSSGRLTMWIRRIHLYSGLLMFPWVLLYGFTALLFNRPQVFTDSRTEVRYLQLDADKVRQWFAADDLATRILQATVDSSQPSDETVEKTRSDPTSSLAQEITTDDAIASLPPQVAVALGSAFFGGTVSYSRETPSATETLTIDPNSGSAVHRITTKPVVSDQKRAPKKTELPQPFPWVEHQPEVLAAAGVEDSEKWILQRQPSLEFRSTDESTSKLYRFTPISRENRGRGTSTTSDKSAASTRVIASGDLIVVGDHPRDLPWRTYLLRLHTAHGYPFEMNARWFWAITVDAMFACMVFWGFSGLIMWWQIKRTRLLGSFAIAVSLILAISLAIAMHWEMVHG